jgi:hypothetical protein
MDALDRAGGASRLARDWNALGRHVAVAAAAAVALLSLCSHVPVWLACARAAVLWLALSVLTRLGALALARSRPDARGARGPR